MASKYAALKGKLPVFVPDSSFMDKVNAWRQSEYGENPEDANVSALAARLYDLNRQKDVLEAEISEINVAQEALSRMLVEIMEAENQEKIKLTSGNTVGLRYSPYPQVKDKEALLGWLKKKKLANLRTLPYKTLEGICNELLQQGKPMPSGVACFLKSSARIYTNGND